MRNIVHALDIAQQRKQDMLKRVSVLRLRMILLELVSKCLGFVVGWAWYDTAIEIANEVLSHDVRLTLTRSRTYRLHDVRHTVHIDIRSLGRATQQGSGRSRSWRLEVSRSGKRGAVGWVVFWGGVQLCSVWWGARPAPTLRCTPHPLSQMRKGEGLYELVFALLLTLLCLLYTIYFGEVLPHNIQRMPPAAIHTSPTHSTSHLLHTSPTHSTSLRMECPMHYKVISHHSAFHFCSRFWSW